MRLIVSVILALSEPSSLARQTLIGDFGADVRLDLTMRSCRPPIWPAYALTIALRHNYAATHVATPWHMAVFHGAPGGVLAAISPR
jgi:hypothetical protein